MGRTWRVPMLMRLAKAQSRMASEKSIGWAALRRKQTRSRLRLTRRNSNPNRDRVHSGPGAVAGLGHEPPLEIPPEARLPRARRSGGREDVGRGDLAAVGVIDYHAGGATAAAGRLAQRSEEHTS